MRGLTNPLELSAKALAKAVEAGATTITTTIQLVLNIITSFQMSAPEPVAALARRCSHRAKLDYNYRLSLDSATQR